MINVSVLSFLLLSLLDDLLYSLSSLFFLRSKSWDDRGSTVLSAVTAGIRASWMSAIRRAANLPDPDNGSDSLTVCQDNNLAQQDNTPQSPTA